MVPDRPVPICNAGPVAIQCAPRIAPCFMHRSLVVTPLVVIAAVMPPAVRAQADHAHGAAAYAAQCAPCHGSTGEGGQGPALGGIAGRKAASGAFDYSPALRRLGWTWNAARLDRYLADPKAVAPGTSMPVRVTDANERRHLVAWLSTLKDDASNRAPAGATRPGAGSAFGGWRDDAPGKRHRIAVAPDGTVFVAETDIGRVRALRPSADGTRAEAGTVFASGLDEPFGLAFHPARDPRWLYVAETNRVIRHAYRAGQARADGAAEVVLARISPTSGGHSNRDLAVSDDGRRMFVGVGSASNVAEAIGRRSASDVESHERERGVGAAWGSEEGSALVLAFTPEGRDARSYADGIRNCSGIAVHPRTGDVWCSTNERDRLGDDLVPDYVTRVREGGFYGWPWWYIGDHEDPRLAGQRPDLRGKVLVPEVLLQPHAASLGIAFDDGARLPAAWRGSAFAAEHGSWNRANRTGPKLIRIPLDASDAPTAGGVIWRIAYEGP